MSIPVRPAFAVFLLVGCACAFADEAQDTFDKLYGDDLKRVAASPSAAEHVALAKQLLEAAGKATNQQAFLAILCEKAHELAAKDPAGFPTAKAALELLVVNVPEKKVECLQKLAAMYQRPYATARGDAKVKAGEALIEAIKALAEAQAGAEDVDAAGATLKQALAVATAIKSDSKAALQAQLAGLAPQQQVEKQVAALKAKLDKDPSDAASRKELVRLFVVELDNPAEAAKFIDETLDESTRRYVPAATKPLEEAPELACNELGDWYRGLADQTTAPASKGAMLERAKAYYQRFLDLHKTDDLARTAATLMLKKIDDALTKLGSAAQGRPGTSTLTLDLGNGVTMKLVRIRPGKFLMGSPDTEQGNPNEKPQHEVTISRPFFMGVTKVTQAQYDAVMAADKGPVNDGKYPVNGVNWINAMDFCRKLSERTRQAIRLPTEAEWEYASRAGSKTRFFFGDSGESLGEYAWYESNSDRKMHPVGQKKPNPWGLYDMHGIIFEWCADWYGDYSKEAVKDPQGPASGTERVLRGGNYFYGAGWCRDAVRISIRPDGRQGGQGGQVFGFRVAASAGGLGLK